MDDGGADDVDDAADDVDALFVVCAEQMRCECFARARVLNCCDRATTATVRDISDDGDDDDDDDGIETTRQCTCFATSTVPSARFGCVGRGAFIFS